MTEAAPTIAAQAELELESAAVWLPLDSLRGWARNPRVNDHVVEEVALSVIRFGFGNPILARAEDREVIAGHTRMKAAAVLPAHWARASEAERAAWKPSARRVALERIVPVRAMELSAHEAHLLALADNRLAEKADWNEQELLAILREYDELEVQAAGWSAEELAQMVAELSPDFAPTDEDEQGELDKLAPQIVTCPECGHAWDLKKA